MKPIHTTSAPTSRKCQDTRGKADLESYTNVIVLSLICKRRFDGQTLCCFDVLCQTFQYSCRYAPIMKKILERHRSQIHGAVHCSGGAQTKAIISHVFCVSLPPLVIAITLSLCLFVVCVGWIVIFMSRAIALSVCSSIVFLCISSDCVLGSVKADMDDS